MNLNHRPDYFLHVQDGYTLVQLLLFLLGCGREILVELRKVHKPPQSFQDEVKAATFISQRTDFNINFKSEHFDFYMSFQNIRVWGNIPQLNTTDKYGIALHQAWAN